MFWIGLIVGMIIATIVIAGLLVYACSCVYGTMETFKSMVDVTVTAAMNPVSEVKVYHDGEELEASAIFGA